MAVTVKTSGIKDAIKNITASLNEGRLCCLPTDTVYGLACLPAAVGSLERLYAAKDRDSDKPVALVFAGLTEIFDRLSGLPEKVRKAMTKIMPGPVTVVVAARSAELAALNMPQTGSLGLRVVPHPVGKLFKALPAPLALSSANLSGEPDPCAAEDISGRISAACDYIIDAGRIPVCKPSTVVDLRPFAEGGPVKILRHGVVPEKEINSRIDSCGCF